jgi:hypothetical protein
MEPLSLASVTAMLLLLPLLLSIILTARWKYLQRAYSKGGEEPSLEYSNYWTGCSSMG